MPRNTVWNKIGKYHKTRPLQFVCLALLVLAGCSGRPGRVASPEWQPEDLAARAVELLDKNQDGVIDEQELAAAPGLASAVWHLDADGDKGISQSELEARLVLYEELRVGLMSLPVQVTLNGRPLPGAEVRLIPEEWLQGVIEPATGTTDRSGVVYPATEGEDFPGVRIGFYRVEVESRHLNPEKAKKALAALGVEASPVSDGEQSSGTIELDIRY